MVGAISDATVAMSVSTVLPEPTPARTAGTPLDPAGLAMTFFASGKAALASAMAQAHAQTQHRHSTGIDTGTGTAQAQAQA